MHQTIFSLRPVLALGAFLTLLGLPAAYANTPRGTQGTNTGSEVAPINLTRSRITFQVPEFKGSIADLLLSSQGYRFFEVIGELRAVFPERAVPPGESGIEIDSPGYARIDLKRAGSTPSNVAARLATYAARLGNNAGVFRVFGNTQAGVTKNINIVVIPKPGGQIELQFTSIAGQPRLGNPATQTILAPNAKVAAVIVGVLNGLDVAGASPATRQAAIAMSLSLSQVSLSAIDAGQVAQILVEMLTTSEGSLSACGRDGSTLTCANLNTRKLAAAIQAYNAVITRSNDPVLVALSNNAEFQTLGESLRRLRTAVSTGRRSN